MPEYTPMIQQYLDIKQQHQEAILFFRLGDFYEMFFQDAELASRELEIVLTARDGGNEKVPMCGIPYHAASNYISRLINRGHKVAICEQVEDPRSAKGIVKREVIRIVTPGTVIEDTMLEEGKNNYLVAIVEAEELTGFAYIDISTAEFKICEFREPGLANHLEDELQRLAPAECLLAGYDSFARDYLDNPNGSNMVISPINEKALRLSNAVEILVDHFKVGSLEGFGLTGYSAGIKAAAAIIAFLQDTQKGVLKHLRSLGVYTTNNYMEMDHTTRRNLELCATMREGRREGSLLGVLDQCRTAMGKRGIKKWLEQPLKNIDEIKARLDAVQELKDNLVLRGELTELLAGIYDMERLAARIGGEIACPRDLLALKYSIKSLQEIKNLDLYGSELLRQIAAVDSLDDIFTIVDQSIDEEAPVSIREGNIIKSGFNQDIDELKQLSRDGSQWLIDYEIREKQRTGIKFLKVGYNKVFGYYIEITRPNLHLVPAEYIRKQTLVNSERFISDDLKQYEEKILGARERLYTLEHQVFTEIRDKISLHLERIQQSAAEIARLDVLVSLAQVAYLNNYQRPVVDNSMVIEIKGGRHPVVEKSLKNSRFIPNDLKLNCSDKRFAIITGPNMGGKSTYMRQAALLVIMAQMGSFVPADFAHIGIADKVFTRVGASDDLSAGHSTFMVEMVEVANILNNATAQSLVVLDEIGRGTSTYDGLSIARAISEYIHDKLGARALFATHYHELTTLSDEFEGIFNLSVSVMESGENVVFLKKVLPGKADRSYGVHVAALAGVPEAVIKRAQAVLTGLENLPPHKKEAMVQLQLFEEDDPMHAELQQLDLDSLSPREALALLYRWKETIN